MASQLSPARTSQQLRLRDGRQLGFAEYGDPQGDPLFYFHGWPSSRLEAQAVESRVTRQHLRVIAIDRPGYGLSEFQPRRTIVQIAEDVSQVANQLGIGRFSVLGVSGGGPYAAACAARIPARVTHVTLVCSLAPLNGLRSSRGMAAGNRVFLHGARYAPGPIRRLGEFFLERMRRRADLIFLPQIEAGLPECDRQSLATDALKAALSRSCREAFRQGVRGAAWDGCLYAGDWGFRLQDIEIPVRVWHGEADIIVPLAMGRQLAASLRKCEATFCPNEGHFSLPFNRIEEIMDGGR